MHLAVAPAGSVLLAVAVGAEADAETPFAAVVAAGDEVDDAPAGAGVAAAEGAAVAGGVAAAAGGAAGLVDVEGVFDFFTCPP